MLLGLLTLAVVSPESETARRLKRTIVFSFLLSCQKRCSAIGPLYEKLVGRRSKENPALITV